VSVSPNFMLLIIFIMGYTLSKFPVFFYANHFLELFFLFRKRQSATCESKVES
jgi:hypothetical protein